MYEKSKLNNGLRLVTNLMSHMDSVSLGVWIGVGGRYEKKSDKGIAHVLEHLSFKGTRKYSANQIKETIEGVGGSLNALTGEEYTCYLVKTLSRRLDTAIDILSDMVLRPLLLNKDLEKEKSVILEEIKMYHDLPQYYVLELLDGLLWPGHTLGMNLAGTQESVSSIDQRKLIGFHNEFYHPGNIVVAACGRLEHEKILCHLSEIFSKVSGKHSVRFRKVTTSQDEAQSRFVYKDNEQSHLAIGYISFKRDHPDRHALGLLHVILGANMSSRLYNEVREKRGLAYDIGTQLRRFHDTGAFLIHAGVDNRKVSLTVSTILKEINRISKHAVSESEFSRAKEYYTGQLLMSLEDTLEHMAWLGEQGITCAEIKSMEDVLGEINKVTIDDILRVAGLIFRNKSLNLSLIGPQKEKERLIISRMLS